MVSGALRACPEAHLHLGRLARLAALRPLERLVAVAGARGKHGLRILIRASPAPHVMGLDVADAPRAEGRAFAGLCVGRLVN